MAQPPRRPSPGSGLHQCVLCHGEFVVPVLIEELDDSRWHLLLRCGECQTYRELVIGNAIAQRYEQDLERGITEIAVAFDRLDRERMVNEMEALIVALERDLVDAADFALG